MEDYYEYLDSNGVTTLYKLIKDDTVALIDSYSVTVNGITTNLDNHINDSDIHTPITDIENMVNTKISGLVNSAPETLDTLKELSDALGNDPNFATTIANQIGNKANSVHSHVVSNITDFPAIPTKLSQLENDMGFGTGGGSGDTSISWTNITDKPNFSTVATSGSYTDLSNTPTIPTKLSDLSNDSGFAIDSDVVHTSGNETIGGNKSFSNTIYRKADVTTSTVEEVYRLADTNVTPCGSICNRMYWHNNNVYNRHQSYNATSGKYMYFEVLSHNDGSGVVNTGGSVTNNENLTTVTNATGNSYVATMGWVNNPATSTNVVHRSGDETINGIKTFTQGINIQKSDIDLTITPTSNKYSTYLFTDKNNNSLGVVQYAQRQTDVNDLDLYVYDKNSTAHGIQINTNNELLPIGGNYSLGSSSAKWANVYATTFNGNLKGNADTATKSSCLDNYSNVGGNKIYLDWDNQVKSYVGLKVDNTTMGGLITTKNIGSQAANSATYATTQATTDNSTKIATTAWVRTYVDSVVGSGSVGASVSAYYSNATTLTATGSTTGNTGIYPADYSDYINIAPTVGTIYTGSQLFSSFTPTASGTINKVSTESSSVVYQTTASAKATFSGAFSSSAKYLCTTANAVKFRAYVSQGTPSTMGSPSVVDQSSTKSIFIRVQ